MLDVLVVFGTRPELIKLAPVIAALKARRLSVGVVATGQHTSLLDVETLSTLGVEVHTLGVESDGSVLRFSARAEAALRSYLAWVQPRAVVVQGDTMSAHAGAMAAHAARIPVAHVEAGLRSGDDSDPWPEELIRRDITRVATWHYAPTQHAALHVATELGLKRNVECVVTGNTSVDALRASGVVARPEASPTVVVTLHRREFRERPGAAGVLAALVHAIASTPHVSALWPVHPGMLDLVAAMPNTANLTLSGPLPHATMLRVLAESRGFLTDSGGGVEEAATLGVPTAVLRNVTDRPEAEDAGIAVRFPVSPDGAILAWNMLARCAIARMPCDAFGSGDAAVHIARHLAKVLK